MKICQTLLVEDNPIHQGIITRWLIKIGCQVTLADTIEKAIELLDDQKNQYDIIILDIGLPDGNGREIANHVRSSKEIASYAAHIVVQTAHLNAQDKQECLDVGVDMVYTKPLRAQDYDILEKIVGNICKG